MITQLISILIERYQHLFENDSDLFIKFWVCIYELYLFIGDHDTALNWLSTSQLPEQYSCLELTFKFIHYKNQNQFDEAEKLLKQVIKQYPNNVQILTVAAYYYYERNIFDRAL